MMASYSTHFCTLCQKDDVSTQAISWCLECEDWLCTDCEKHHGRSKTSIQHKTITIAAYGTLPPNVLKISNRCIEHNFKFERFCSFHGAPCCIQCVREAHKDCELSPLVDVLQNVKESVAVYHLERDLNEIQKNLEVVEKHLLERITKVNDKKKHNCLNEIKRIRTSVNEHLDRIERNIVDELSKKEKDIRKTIESFASQIESKKRRVVNLHDSLLKTKQYATDLQIFLSIKEMEKQTSEHTKYVEDLEKSNEMIDRSLQFVVSPALQSLERDVVDFGKISVNSMPSTFKLTRTNQGQAKLFCPVVSNLDKILTIKLAKRKTSLLNLMQPGLLRGVITAGTILPSGECIFANYLNDCLMLFDSEGRYVRDVIQSSGRPFDMCYIHDNVVGISVSKKQVVHFIDVSKNKIVKRIQMESSCYGIDCNDGKLCVRLSDNDTIVIMDLDGKIEHRVNIHGKDVARVAFYKNCIYCINFETSEVFCCDLIGNIIWIHKYEALVKPRSITIDKRSDIIYVAGLNPDIILAISLDGDQSKTVLSKADGLKQVRSVRVSSDKKLLVCNGLDGLAFLYKL